MDDFYTVTHTDVNGNASDVKSEIGSLLQLLELLGPNESITVTRIVR